MAYDLQFGDCLELMNNIADKSISLIYTDLPYKITDCKWDSGIDLNKLWEQYKRLLKPNGVVVLHSVQPFTTEIINSNQKWFKYNYVWIKMQAANFQLAKYMPLKKHEDVCVFYLKKPTYNPQMWKGEPKAKRIGKEVYQERKNDMYLSSKPASLKSVISDEYYPTTILNFKGVARNQSIHRTQKPVELAEFIIKTYTNEGETVLDNCVGSGTTIIACENTGRNCIAMENDEEVYAKCRERLSKLLTKEAGGSVGANNFLKRNCRLIGNVLRHCT